MELITLLNRCHRLRGFVYQRARCELSAAVRKLETVAPTNPVMPVADGFVG
jgi:hypothetical protein